MQPFTQSKNEMKTRTHKRKKKQFCIMRLIPFHQNHRASGKRENITILPTVCRSDNFKPGITKSKTERRMNFKLVSLSWTTLLSSTKFHYDQMQFLKGHCAISLFPARKWFSLSQIITPISRHQFLSPKMKRQEYLIDVIRRCRYSAKKKVLSPEESLSSG